MKHPLDNPTWASLRTTHARFAHVHGQAARFENEVAPFAAITDDPTPRCWSDLQALFAPGATVVLVDAPEGAPPGWEMLGQTSGVQVRVDGELVAMAGERLQPP